MCQVANVSAGRSARVIQGGKKRRRRHKLQQRAAQLLVRNRNKCKLQYVPVSKIAKEFRKTPIDSIEKKYTIDRCNKGTLSPFMNVQVHFARSVYFLPLEYHSKCIKIISRVSQ